jgi:GntR family transcriptional regulator
MVGALTIQFRLDRRSGMPVYRQLVDQVRQALQLGTLQPGDQLPTVREVVGQIAINPNTVHRAYRELEQEGLVQGRPGQGTFVQRSLATASPARQEELRDELVAWARRAREAGLDAGIMEALFRSSLEAAGREEDL